ncbi:alpha-E domain-containing protein [Thioalkalivibrio sp.]|uniref:alpha-E domain-containing protein n=1 Tax=Thioalkalivibrio sp. TaxID=2093813 RepID=UPI0012D5E61F|nr:alpha-E domain-containing protein [Thioalkalivibrio sp.]TVP77317.1 MAG: alpha-E domain-containing protein [Thioalkalivibrio sp.]
MLSRVAERLYWLARYIERAENTARMVMSFNLVSLDMPKTVKLSWKGLVAVTGTDDIFDEHYQRDDERNCVKFLLADHYNPSSVFSSLKSARENVRTTRDLVPSEAWEIVNELFLFARDNMDAGIGKRGRYQFLSEIVQRCQTLTGLLAGCMSHDPSYDFIRLGRNLERADMTSRQIDVGAIRFLKKTSDDPSPYDGLLWTSILRSQSGFQMYRQHVKRRINGADVVRFLLQDIPFPRAVAHALRYVQEALERLPRNEVPLRLVMQARRHALGADVDQLISEDRLHDFLDSLQQDIAEIHDAIVDTWFSLERAA